MFEIVTKGLLFCKLCDLMCKKSKKHNLALKGSHFTTKFKKISQS